MNKEYILSISDEYERALYLVSELFKNKTDKIGVSYISHLIRVSIKLDSRDLKIAGLLHDIIEDTPLTSKDLKEYGFNNRVIELVEKVTKDNSIPYNDWIKSIVSSGDLDLIKLKYADMSDNYNIERLKLLPEEIRKRLTIKYKDNLNMLKEVIENAQNKSRTHI